MNRLGKSIFRMITILGLMGLFVSGAVAQTAEAELFHRTFSGVDAQAKMSHHGAKESEPFCDNPDATLLDGDYDQSKSCRFWAKKHRELADPPVQRYGLQAWVNLLLPKQTRVGELAIFFSVTITANQDQCYRYGVKGWQHVDGWEDKEITYRKTQPECEIQNSKPVIVGGLNKPIIVPIKDDVNKLQVWVEGSGDSMGYDDSVEVNIEFYETIPYAYPLDSTKPTVKYIDPQSLFDPNQILTGVTKDLLGEVINEFVVASVQDTGSGLGEVSVNCKSRQDPSATLPLGAAIDVNVPAFSPGTTDPIYIRWVKAGGITDKIACGVWTRDLAGNERWCQYRKIGTACE